jgi:adenylate cyclase class IV
MRAQALRRNIEAKWRHPRLEDGRTRALSLGAREAGHLEQRDTFFVAPRGRLKLREFGDGSAELIAYQRPDSGAARESNYVLCAAPEPRVLADALTHALGLVGVVVKKRELLLFEHTRIHLDRVDGLGSFIELETVVTTQTDAEACNELDRIAAALALDPAERVAVAYIDLLRRHDAG